jgi:thiol-disulfide isomerase/thioredoxin
LLLIFFPRREKLLPPPWPHPFHCLAVAIPACLFIGALVPTLAFNKVPDVVVDKTGKEVIRVVRPDKWTVKPAPVKTVQEPPVEPNLPVTVVETNIPAPVVETDTPTVVVEPNLPAAANDVNTSEQVTAAQPDANDIPEWKLMLNHVDIAEQLLTDVRIVMFYHYDCPDCAVAIPLYNQYSSDLAADEHIQFAFIKGPPYGPDDQDPVPDDTTALVGKLDLSRDWIFESPLIFLLNNGELVQWWLVEYPDFDQLLQAILTVE